MYWPNDHDIHAKLLHGRTHPTHGFFMEIFLVVGSKLWNLRNDKIFNNSKVTRRLWISNFKKQVLLQLLRVKESSPPHPQPHNPQPPHPKPQTPNPKTLNPKP